MINGAQVLALVPARSGSKGIPGKNIRILAGKPLLAWIIEAARKSRWIDRLVCSTDSEEYASIARHYGAETPFLRPPELASDSAIDIEVLTHAVRWLEHNQRYRPDFVIRLQCTNPTFSTELIDRGIEILAQDPTADSVRAVMQCDKHPYKMWKLRTGTGLIESFLSHEITGYHESFNMGRQQLPKVFIQVGAMEVLRYRTLIELRSMAGQRVCPLIVEDPFRGVDIDNELDFEIAESAMKYLGIV